MKLFERLFKHITLAFLLCFFAPSTASSPNNEPTLQADSIEISLLTCGPRQQVYSLYGHTAIRFQDKQTGRDIAINYGVFSFDQPFFVLRFVFGLTDYEMGIAPFDIFEWEYDPTGCGVRQQVLNLTAQEKMAIAQAVDRNMEPQNRVYRYNFFYDNCTTRARDIIANNLNGRIVYDTSTPQHLNTPTSQRPCTIPHVPQLDTQLQRDASLGTFRQRPASWSESRLLYNIRTTTISTRASVRRLRASTHHIRGRHKAQSGK